MIAGIDVGGTKTICAIADDDNNIISQVQFKTLKADPEKSFDNCISYLNQVAYDAGVKVCDLKGIGMCVPGMVGDKGTLLHAPFLEWHDVDVNAIVSRKTGVSYVKCDCDVNACAFAESKISGCDNFLWVTVSTGIGSAPVIDGKILRGANAVAGEIGHCKVEFDNPRKCTCGQVGCAEAQASGVALSKMVKEYCENHPEYDAKFESRSLPRDAAGCSVLANEGDETSIGLFNIAGDYLGRALCYAVNLFAPERIYIGGGMSRSLNLLLPAIRKRLESDVVAFSKDVPIMQTKLGYEASLIGSLYLAHK